MPVNWFMWNVQFLTEAVGQLGVMKPGSSGRVPVVPRICEAIKSQIRAGALGPGARLRRRPTRLRYGDPCGSPELRAALQGYLWRARGLRCDPDQIVVVNGSQQGLDLCARLLLDPGDRAVIENPCYGLARQTFMAA